MEHKLNHMTSIVISENIKNQNNLFYIQSSIGELLSHANCSIKASNINGRTMLLFNCPECYSDIIRTEIADKVAEILAIKYKYEYFKKQVPACGLSAIDREILLTSLIAADLDDDKKYAFDRVKQYYNICVDGIYNFRLGALKNKWEDIACCIPSCFMNTQLKDFIYYLLENKKKRVYVDDGLVYDCHFRQLKRSMLLDGESLKIIREILLSNCGEVELKGQIPKEDEYYLKEYYNDKIYFSERYRQ